MDFSQFLPLIKLHGSSYRPLKIAVLYAVLAHRVRKSIVTLGNGILDLRIPVMVVLPSGYGKGDFKHFIEDNTPSEPNRDQSYVEPTSLHSEQLVGKTVRDRSSRGVSHVLIRGFLDATFVSIDEAIPFLTLIRYNEARIYVRTTLDPIGQNTIMKRNVDIPVQYGLEYQPDCSMVIFLQDVGGGGISHLPYELVSEGLLRRFLILYPSISEEERIKGFDESITPIDDIAALTLWKQALDNLEKISKEYAVDWDITGVTQLLQSRAKELLNLGVRRGGLCKRFSDAAMYDLRRHLTRMSCIQAGVDGRWVVIKDDVEVAFRDLREIWTLHLNFVAEMISPVRGARALDSAQIDALQFLLGKGCLYEGSSSVTIRELKSQIVGLSENHYRRLRERGLIESKQIGQTDTRVWITENGVQRLREVDEL